MAITRSVLEAKLIRANANLLGLARVPTDIVDNPFVGDAIEEALLALGLTVATLGSVSDSDLAGVSDSSMSYFFAQCSLSLHQAILAALIPIVSEMVTTDQVMYSDAARALKSMIDQEAKAIQVSYVVGQASCAGGVMAPNPVVPDAIRESYL